MKHKAVLALQKDGKVFPCESVAEWQFWKSHKDTVEMREIEWEKKEPVRVADYLLPSPFSLGVGGKCLRWNLETHPIGQQPEGSVMVPNSEREVTE